MGVLSQIQLTKTFRKSLKTVKGHNRFFTKHDSSSLHSVQPRVAPWNVRHLSPSRSRPNCALPHAVALLGHHLRQPGDDPECDLVASLSAVRRLSVPIVGYVLFGDDRENTDYGIAKNPA